MSLVFIYIIEITPLENGNHEFLWVIPFFHKNWGLKPQKFEISLGTSKANVNFAWNL